MRYTPAFSELPIHVLLDSRRIQRWVWLGRVVLACAILMAAAFVWNKADPVDTLVASLAFAATMLGTSLSVVYAEIYRLPTGKWFQPAQTAMDLLLVTAVVHVTGGWSSQFAALYVLVIAASALLLPARSGYVVAALSCALYAVDVVWVRGESAHLGIAVQSVVFLVVGAGADAIARRLQSAGSNREALAARLANVQLEAADILRTIRSGIMTVDARGRLLYANPAASDLLAMHLRGFTGKPVIRVLREVSPELADLLERTARDGQRTTRAEGVIRRDGQTIPIGVTTTTVERARGELGQTATAIFQDISASKRIQALNVRAERLQAVAELSASLAHEIRNPLASIRSATEQLARRSAQMHQGDEDGELLHSLIVREADRLDRLLGEFLDFARARATRSTNVDIAQVVQSAVRMVASHPSCGSGITITTGVIGSGLVVDGDEDLIHRALFNLLLNAVQVLTTEGAVTVNAGFYDGPIPASPSRDAGMRMIGISVTDNGPGVPFELRDRLFEPFVTGRVGGSGLGLSVVFRAAESHDGLVLVDHLEPGTRFTILLPAADTEHGSPAPAHDVDAIFGIPVIPSTGSNVSVHAERPQLTPASHNQQ